MSCMRHGSGAPRSRLNKRCALGEVVGVVVVVVESFEESGDEEKRRRERSRKEGGAGGRGGEGRPLPDRVARPTKLRP